MSRSTCNVAGAELPFLSPRRHLMAMPLRVPMPTYTTTELREFPPDGCRYELVNGMLLVTPAPAHSHQAILMAFTSAVLRYLDGRARAASPGVVEVAPTLHLEPDLLVYPAHYGPASEWTDISGWWLALEVSGRDSRRYDRDYKRSAYLAVGVREVWLVDLVEKCVLVSRAGEQHDRRHAERLTWHPPELAEPLELDVRVLFHGLG